MNLTLKKEFQNKVISRRSKISGATISIDTAKMSEDKYEAYYNIGFQDIFEEGTKKVTVEVDNLNDLTYKELKEQAIEKGIDFPANIKKVDLIELLNQ